MEVHNYNTIKKLNFNLCAPYILRMYKYRTGEVFLKRALRSLNTLQFINWQNMVDDLGSLF